MLKKKMTLINEKSNCKEEGLCKRSNRCFNKNEDSLESKVVICLH